MTRHPARTCHGTYDATIPWIEAPGFSITCCNNGPRPVIFKIEQTPEEAG